MNAIDTSATRTHGKCVRHVGIAELTDLQRNDDSADVKLWTINPEDSSKYDYDVKFLPFSILEGGSDNYGIGLFGFINDVDIEEINGNSYAYGYGALFTTFHEFEFFNLSTAS